MSAVIAGFAVFVTLAGEEVVMEVSYERLLAGQVGTAETRVELISATVHLTAAADPADELYAFLAVRPGYRLVEFRFQIENRVNRNDADIRIRASRFSLRDTNDEEHVAILATVNRTEFAPVNIAIGEVVTVSVVFSVPNGTDPVELKYDVVNYIGFPRVGETIIYEFR